MAFRPPRDGFALPDLHICVYSWANHLSIAWAWSPPTCCDCICGVFRITGVCKIAAVTSQRGEERGGKDGRRGTGRGIWAVPAACKWCPWVNLCNTFFLRFIFFLFFFWVCSLFFCLLFSTCLLSSLSFQSLGCLAHPRSRRAKRRSWFCFWRKPR